MKHLYTLALTKYQNHLNIIRRLNILGAITNQAYSESCKVAKRLYVADNKMVKLLEYRQSIIQESRA